jgi:uncharacterized tellurite resistance protein B-like protein
MDRQEILNLVAILGFMIKADTNVLISEKKTFGIICSRFGVQSFELRNILANSSSLKELLQQIKTQEAKTLLVELMALVSSTDGKISENEERSLLKIMEVLGESCDKFPFFDEKEYLDVGMVLESELQILAKLPPTVPI